MYYIKKRRKNHPRTIKPRGGFTGGRGQRIWTPPYPLIYSLYILFLGGFNDIDKIISTFLILLSEKDFEYLSL